MDEFLRSRFVPWTSETEEGKGEEDGDGDGGGGGHGHGIRPQPCTFIQVGKMGHMDFACLLVTMDMTIWAPIHRGHLTTRQKDYI